VLAAVDYSSGGGGVVPEQMELHLCRVYLDKTLLLAPNGKQLKSHWITAGNKLVEDLASQYKLSSFYSGQRFRKSIYIPIISSILANLLNANNRGLQVVFSRDHCSGNRAWIKVWDFMAELHLIHMDKASKNEIGIKSWAVAMPVLVKMLQDDRANIVFNPNKPSIVIRDKDKKELPVPRRKTTHLQYKRIEQAATALNEQWTGHKVTLRGRAIIPVGRRIFNGSLDLGGRFYGDVQTFSSEDRKHFKIDGKKTIEIDYKCMHLAVLHAWEGLQMDYTADYTLEGYARPVIKDIVLRMLNIKRLANLKAAITRSANPKNQAKYKIYKAAWAAHEGSRAKRLKSTRPKKPRWLDSFMPNIPVGTNANDVVEALVARYSTIAKHIGSKDLGLRLQAVDSKIMALVQEELRQCNIRTLPIHDSIIVQENHKAKAMMVMRNVFKKETGFYPQVTTNLGPINEIDGNQQSQWW